MVSAKIRGICLSQDYSDFEDLQDFFFDDFDFKKISGDMGG